MDVLVEGRVIDGVSVAVRDGVIDGVNVYVDVGRGLRDLLGVELATVLVCVLVAEAVSDGSSVGVWLGVNVLLGVNDGNRV